MTNYFKRPVYESIYKRVMESRKFIQVITGPRQTGKTTLAKQLMKELPFQSHYASSDEPTLKDRTWIDQQWQTGRLKIKKQNPKILLILDEIQKINGWSETVKRLWDEDTMAELPLQVIILGSSALLLQKGLSESLAGRFEIINVTHWSFQEMQKAFGWSVEQYAYYGGYPGAAELISDHHRWSRYILDSIIETSVSRDILLMVRVYKPALLRRLFELGSSYSGQILSYQKMLGQLQDAGNTTTLAHYMRLLESAGMIAGLPKFSGKQIRQRASSPKLLVLNTALMTAPADRLFEETKNDSQTWGRLVESSIGASLYNGLKGTQARLFYWSDRNREVDFVISRGDDLITIEVKSGYRKTSLPGLKIFSNLYSVKRKLLIGGQGIPIKDFFLTSTLEWLI